MKVLVAFMDGELMPKADRRANLDAHGDGSLYGPCKRHCTTSHTSLSESSLA